MTIPLLGRPPVPVVERLWSHSSVDPNGCWVWGGHVSPSTGYSTIWYQGTNCLIHRVSYEIHKGLIPEGLSIDHLCRNRICWNPEHLEAVPIAVNIRRRIPRNQNVNKTHCKRGHEFTQLSIYRSPSQPDRRVCRICVSNRQRQQYQEKKHVL